MERVLLLNYDYTFLAMISWKKALKLMNKQKVEVIKYADDVIKAIGTVIQLPKVLKLVYFIKRIHKAHMAYSKRVVLTRDNFECAYCGSGDRLTIDHILPKARGGKTVFENVVTCCFSCNNKKGDKTPEEAGMKSTKRAYAPTIIEYIMRSAKKRGEELGDILKDLIT